MHEQTAGITGKALVLGATGGIGGEMARQLIALGWEVHALRRNVAQGLRDGVVWWCGDALNGQDVLCAADGCTLIVHAVNPPGYRHWAEWVLPMADNAIAAAVANRATLVLPGTVYNYGPEGFPRIDEEAPQRPLTRKGAIRVQLEQRLQAATERGARVLIVRAGDYFGPAAANNWFGQALVQPGKPVTTVRMPGAEGMGHQWAYLPDVARTVLALLDRREALPAFARFHMDGHWDPDGRALAQAIMKVAARHGLTPRLRRFPWWQVWLAAPLMPTLRELLEMRYLWRVPLRLDNTRLLSVLGQEPHTPLEEAVEQTLLGLGCLPTTSVGLVPHLPAR